MGNVDKSVMRLPMYGTYQDDSENPKWQAEVLALSAKKESLKLYTVQPSRAHATIFKRHVK